MTETEWLECADPSTQIEFLWGKDDRKMRLFAVACCRRIWRLIPEPLGQTCVEAAERFAEGQIAASELDVIRDVAAELHRTEQPITAGLWAVAAAIDCTQPNASYAAVDAHKVAQTAAGLAGDVDTPAGDAPTNHKNAWQVEGVAQSNFLRDIFGNPFRPITFDPGRRTADVTNLAEAIYADRAFDRLPILADALEDAGCTDHDILDHCRGPGIHVRGCWVVDLVLGKS